MRLTDVRKINDVTRYAAYHEDMGYEMLLSYTFKLQEGLVPAFDSQGQRLLYLLRALA